MVIREYAVQGELESVGCIQVLEHDLATRRIQPLALTGNCQQCPRGQTLTTLLLAAWLKLAQGGGSEIGGRGFYSRQCRSIRREWEMLRLPFLRCFSGMESRSVFQQWIRLRNRDSPCL
jgi:hypothetical protein